MSLINKLLRQHISVPQFLGFVLANLIGMFIVMLGYQFYCDIIPIFNDKDSFIGQDYLIVSKRIVVASSLSGSSQNFNAEEIDELSRQGFVQGIGAFQTRQYIAEAQMSIEGKPILRSELPLESVPSDFIDCPVKDWNYSEGSHVVPILLPRSYLNMYNFGFAQSRGLPRIGEGTLSLIEISIVIHGNGLRESFKGRVIGFSNRLNGILVPERFMTWTNERFAPTEKNEPNRLVVKVSNPTDKAIVDYLELHGYELEDDQLQNEKTTYFLRIVVIIVMTVGLVISILSFIILMLSIFLLVQKNQDKLETLLLIGYSPSSVARPYQILTFTLNAAVWVVALAALWIVRNLYMGIIRAVSPTLEFPTIQPAVLLGLSLLALVTVINSCIIQRKVISIWKNKR